MSGTCVCKCYLFEHFFLFFFHFFHEFFNNQEKDNILNKKNHTTRYVLHLMFFLFWKEHHPAHYLKFSSCFQQDWNKIMDNFSNNHHNFLPLCLKESEGGKNKANYARKEFMQHKWNSEKLSAQQIS